MKKLLFLSILFLMGISAQAQRYDIITQDICWNTGSVDSSLTRYFLVSPLASTVKVLAHLNSAGQKVVPSGGTFSAGHCGCCGGTSTSTTTTSTPARSGLFNDGDTIKLGGQVRENTSLGGMGQYGLDATNWKYLNFSATDSFKIITPGLIDAAIDVGGLLQVNSLTGRVEFTPYAFPLTAGTDGQFQQYNSVTNQMEWRSPYVTAVETDTSYRFSVNGSSVSVLSKDQIVVDSISYLVGKGIPIGYTIYSKGLDGKGFAIYKSEADSIKDYPPDSIGSTRLLNGYANYQGTIVANRFGMIGDGEKDSRVGLLKAISYAKASGRNVVEIHNESNDTFLISRALFVYDSDLEIKGVGGPVLRYRSAAAANYPNQPYYPFSSNSLDKHCFFFTEVSGIKVNGIHFVGDRQNHITGVSGTDTLNVGVGIYLRGVADFEISNCKQYNGKSLVQGEGYYNGDTTIVGKIFHCRSENFFGALNPPSGTIIDDCDFIQAPSDSTYFDRIGEFGSSSAIYAYAQRRNIQILNSRFKNLRTTAIKVSGSSGELSNFIIENNEFDLCGTAIAAGGDSGGDGIHSGLIIRNNVLKNVAGVRAGWTLNEAAMRIYGFKHVDIIGNHFSYNRDMKSLGRYCIWVQMQSTGATVQPIENLRINDNKFFRIDGFSPDSLAIQSEVILLSNVNEYGLGSFQIRNNHDDGLAPNFISVSRSINGEISGNSTRSALFGRVTDSALLKITDNTVISTNRLSNDRAIIYTNIGWVEDDRNSVVLNSGKLSNKSANWLVEQDGNERNKPLLLEQTTGIAYPSRGIPTGIIFYGAGWETGDSIKINGNWLKYNTEFDSKDSLINYINSNLSIQAGDYGDSLGVSSGYVVMQPTGVNAPVANSTNYTTQIRSRSNVAGVLPSNNGAPFSSYGNNQIWFGGGSLNQLLVFSPFATHQSNITLSGFDEDSSNFLGFVGSGWIDDTQKQAGAVEVNLSVKPDVSLKFFFQIH